MRNRQCIFVAAYLYFANRVGNGGILPVVLPVPHSRQGKRHATAFAQRPGLPLWEADGERAPNGRPNEQRNALSGLIRNGCGQRQRASERLTAANGDLICVKQPGALGKPPTLPIAHVKLVHELYGRNFGFL